MYLVTPFMVTGIISPATVAVLTPPTAAPPKAIPVDVLVWKTPLAPPAETVVGEWNPPVPVVPTETVPEKSPFCHLCPDLPRVETLSWLGLNASTPVNDS